LPLPSPWPGQLEGIRPGVGVVLLVAAMAIVIAIAVHLGALLLVQHRGVMTAAARLKAENDARVSLIQVLGGIGLVGGLVFTVRTFRLARLTQRTDRFTKAVDQLGNTESEAVRVGGVHALWLLSCEAEEFRGPTEVVLCALVRQRTRRKAALGSDVQAALTVLGRLSSGLSRRRPLDLRGARLQGADLTGANFERARLDGVDMRGAVLIDAVLVSARLAGACLDGADLKSADLRFADLKHASFRDADLYDVNLSGAEIDGCDLSGAQNLTAAQLASADSAPAALPGERSRGRRGRDAREPDPNSPAAGDTATPVDPVRADRRQGKARPRRGAARSASPERPGSRT
jgi:uncharacterized protein YjbI with pentapeptide repeats